MGFISELCLPPWVDTRLTGLRLEYSCGLAQGNGVAGNFSLALELNVIHIHAWGCQVSRGGDLCSSLSLVSQVCPGLNTQCQHCRCFLLFWARQTDWTGRGVGL